MKDMNVSVEVESGLKQLKSSVEVENKLTSILLRVGSKLLKSIAKTLKSRFVYNVCGYHHTPIPSQLQPKLNFAHPSPLVRLFQSKKSTSTIGKLLMGFVKLSGTIKWLSIHCLIGLHSMALYVRNNLNNSQSVSTSTNDISMNSMNNEYNLQSINIDN